MKASIELKLFLTVFLIYGFYVTMTGPSNNIDALCVAMVDYGTFRIDDEVFGNRSITVPADHAIVDGKKYSGYSPGASWLLAPLYWLSKPVCALAPEELEFQAFTVIASLVLTIPLGGLCVVAFYRLLRQYDFSERTAVATTLTFAFGTMWIVYARRHNSYAFISSALIFLSFYLLARRPRPGVSPALASPRSFLLGGFLVMLGVAVDYKNAVVVPWVCAYLALLCRDWKRWIWFVAGGVLPAAAILGYNWHLFGNPLYTPWKFMVGNYGTEVAPQAGVIPLVGTARFHWEYFANLFVGSRTGLFLYVPATILAIVGAVYRWPQKREKLPWLVLTTVGMIGSLAWLAAHFPYWHGSGDKYFQGPATRYLLPAIPFLMILVAFAVQRIRPAISYLFMIPSLAIAWIFVLSANYGKGESPIVGGLETAPLLYHAQYIGKTYGAETVWSKLLTSSHFSLGEGIAALITWCGAGVIGMLVWLIWRTPKPS